MSYQRIYAHVGNYYGRPYVFTRDDGRRMLGIENYDGDEEKPISEYLYQAWLDQFADEEMNRSKGDDE